MESNLKKENLEFVNPEKEKVAEIKAMTQKMLT